MHKRVAIVSSPRSGNTWVRWVLRDAIGLSELAVHNYLELPDLPERCVVQVHWYREPNFQRFLRDNGFQVVVVERHPLDVLLSVLHFVRREPQTARWLEGNCEIPADLSSRDPTSREFVDYALSFGAENLLSPTYQWWQDSSAIKLRYEELVADPVAGFSALAGRLGYPEVGIAEALAQNSLAVFQALPNRHGWQGVPGLWRKLIACQDAQEIYSRHARIFEGLGYTVEATDLAAPGALQNWLALQV